MSSEIEKLKSGSILENKEGCTRVVVVGDWISTSLTAGRDYKTRAMPDNAVAKAKQAMRNIEGALSSVGATLADTVRRRIFIPRQEDVPEVMAYMGEVFRGSTLPVASAAVRSAAPNTSSRSRSGRSAGPERFLRSVSPFRSGALVPAGARLASHAIADGAR